MGRTSLFAAFILLCLALGQCLECKECLLQVQGAGCLTGFGRCTTRPGDPCVAISIYRHNKLYRVYGCATPHSDRCGFSKTYFGEPVTVECCQNGNMCNRQF